MSAMSLAVLCGYFGVLAAISTLIVVVLSVAGKMFFNNYTEVSARRDIERAKRFGTFTVMLFLLSAAANSAVTSDERAKVEQMVPSQQIVIDEPDTTIPSGNSTKAPNAFPTPNTNP